MRDPFLLIIVIFYTLLYHSQPAYGLPGRPENQQEWRHTWWEIVDGAVNRLEGKSLLGSERSSIHWKHATDIVTHRLNKEKTLEEKRAAILKLKETMKAHRKKKMQRRGNRNPEVRQGFRKRRQ